LLLICDYLRNLRSTFFKSLQQNVGLLHIYKKSISLPSKNQIILQIKRIYQHEETNVYYYGCISPGWMCEKR